MPRKPKETAAVGEVKVIRGSHSTRTEYPDGRVEFETHWEELKRDVAEALATVKVVELTEEKVKKTRATRKKKDTV